ncbi:hypothetical protein RIF29_15741 [Crotalaria pallida]|uniref:SANT domain-containing protein n=1 Tax=Crotalaria pallida TaxID=3830 RepID=A0AAN9IEX7_CROPI
MGFPLPSSLSLLAHCFCSFLHNLQTLSLSLDRHPSLRRNLRRLLHPPTAAAPFNHHTIPNRHNLQFSTGIDQLDSDQAHSDREALMMMYLFNNTDKGLLGFQFVLNLITHLMDFFDDILPAAPTARSRAGGKFMPKAKLKQPPRKEISASKQATPSKDGKNEQIAFSSTSTDTKGISEDECHNAVASTLNTLAEESMRSQHHPQTEPSNMVDDTNSEMGNPLQVSVERDSAALGDAPPSVITSEVDANWSFTNHAKSACGVESMEFELHPFSNVLTDPGARNAHKFPSKIKPRPRVDTTPAIASASSNVMIEKSAELPTSCTNETAEIFSGLESLDDLLTQDATDAGKPVLHSCNEKGTEDNLDIPACNSVSPCGACDTQVQKCPKHHEATVLDENGAQPKNRRLETEEIVDLNPACQVDNVFDYQSMKSGAGLASDIPVHEELANAATSPAVADFLHADVTGEKEDANERQDGVLSRSIRKHKRSSVAGEKEKGGKSSKQLRKPATRKPANNPVNENVDDDDLDPPYNPNRDELEDNDDDFEVDDSSKKQRASPSSNKKSGAKNGKTSKKRKQADEDLEKTSKQPRKKFSHSTRRRKRCVDKALLEIPEDELDPLTLPIKDIILLAEYRERLAKKEASSSKIPHTEQSAGDYHDEAGGNNQEDMLGSEDDTVLGEDKGSETIPSAASLFNYQSFMDKAPRGKWSKQDTELFYEAIREFGTDFSMIQQLFPGRTRHQIKLKYKKEERQHPLELSDAVNNRAKDHSHFKLVIEQLQQASSKAKEQDPNRDAADSMTLNEVEDLTETNDDVATTEQDANVKDQEDANVIDQEDTNVKDQEDSVAFHSAERSDDGEEDDEEDYSWYQGVV